MDTSLFSYDLPADRIAQRPIEPRDQAKLLTLERTTGALTDRHIFDLPSLLEPGDLLVFNDSKVFKARLQTTEGIEIFLLRPDGSTWLALARPGRKIKMNDELHLKDGSTLAVLAKESDGTVRVNFQKSADEVFRLTETLGEVPSPPYVEPVENLAQYQTVYARETGSVAAPTAGFHFTERLLKELDAKGIRRAFVTLHVGLGTFRPIKTDTLEAHEMHEEWANVPSETVDAIRETKQNGKRVIVVGTTALRALESATQNVEKKDVLQTFSGFTRIFITPGYTFHVADGLLTNFHLPKSTLLVLISAFAGRERILAAYEHAIKNGYRFYSFGDAMLIF